MLLTEEDAQRKWCPFAREMNDTDLPTTNGSDQFTCIASKCMAWRWKGTHLPDENEVDNTGKSPGMSWNKRTYGYCGLAGKITND